MASSRVEEPRESQSSLQESLDDMSELSYEPRGSTNSIASAASAASYAAEEDDEEDSLANDTEKLSPRPIMGDPKAQQRHEIAMQKAAKLAQLRKQRLAEAGSVKPLAAAPKMALPDDQSKARIAKQLAKAKSLGDARKKKADEPQKIPPRPQGSGTIDEKTQARLAVTIEKAKLLAAKRMNGGTMELPSPSSASSASAPPPPPKMDLKTQARLEKEMAKAKALAAARLAKIENEKVVDEIAPLPAPDAVLTPEMQARLGADIAKAKARAEALQQRKMQQMAEENKKRESRERPEIIEEDPKVLEKRKQELEAIKQRVAEREREKRNLKLAEQASARSVPLPPTRPRASSGGVPSSSGGVPSKIVVSKVSEADHAGPPTPTTPKSDRARAERSQVEQDRGNKDLDQEPGSILDSLADDDEVALPQVCMVCVCCVCVCLRVVCVCVCVCVVVVLLCCCVVVLCCPQVVVQADPNQNCSASGIWHGVCTTCFCCVIYFCCVTSSSSNFTFPLQYLFLHSPERKRKREFQR